MCNQCKHDCIQVGHISFGDPSGKAAKELANKITANKPVAIEQSTWAKYSEHCPWKMRSGCCGATKIECCEEMCAFDYWYKCSLKR